METPFSTNDKDIRNIRPHIYSHAEKRIQLLTSLCSYVLLGQDLLSYLGREGLRKIHPGSSVLSDEDVWG